MAKVTRTLGPLHFEDLEPHRFEDLIRQLIYDFRVWRSLEATGRLGQDDGIDIRGYEQSFDNISIEENENSIDDMQIPEEKLWIVQCKRQKQVEPRDAIKVVEDALPEGKECPYGFIFAAACEFSKRTRDEFRLALIGKGVQEYYLWGKADLEDMLYQPKNDHLLFAFFGFSLQIRRKNMRTDVRSKLALKKNLLTKLGGINHPSQTSVLVRTAEYQPETNEKTLIDSILNGHVSYCDFVGHYIPGKITFLVTKLYGYLDDDEKRFDYMKNKSSPWNFMLPDSVRRSLDGDQVDLELYADLFEQQRNRVFIDVLAYIDYDRVLGVDVDGDVLNPGIHVIVETSPSGKIFEHGISLRTYLSQRAYKPVFLNEKNRIKFFDETIRFDGELRY